MRIGGGVEWGGRGGEEGLRWEGVTRPGGGVRGEKEERGQS